jgi:glutamine cyclotransferase
MPALLLLMLAGCGTKPGESAAGTNGTRGQEEWQASIRQARVPVYGYRITREFPHSRDSFTEGLLLDEGFFYEGTGRRGQSKLLKIEPAGGQVLMSRELEPRYFGEGVTILDGEVFQLTYETNTGFVYDLRSFQPKRDFSYRTQGWGLTNDGTSLIMSDGSATLRFLDPDTMKMERSVTVTDFTGPIGYVNELEYVNGAIYANIWKQDYIARISPEDGRVTGWIDLTGLNPYSGRSAAEFVLNGIAWDPGSGRLIVTGKCWPSLYEIELVDAGGSPVFP